MTVHGSELNQVWTNIIDNAVQAIDPRVVPADEADWGTEYLDAIISARVVETGVRVEVADGSPHSPIVREYGELAGTGRGVRLLDLLARWGVDAILAAAVGG